MKREILNILFALVPLLGCSLTAAAPALAASQVALGLAANFAVLTGTGITNTGTTTIRGDVGTYPTVSETGFETVTLTKTNHAGDSVTQQAKTDLSSGYADAAGRTLDTTVTTIGDLTLKPGVYHGDTLALTGIVTLIGDANAVWIFQSASTLDTAEGSQVILSGGAQSANIYWAVGSSATLGANSIFEGNMLAHDSITLNTGASVYGRVLALNAAVTLDTNTITVGPLQTFTLIAPSTFALGTGGLSS